MRGDSPLINKLVIYEGAVLKGRCKERKEVGGKEEKPRDFRYSPTSTWPPGGSSPSAFAPPCWKGVGSWISVWGLPCGQRENIITTQAQEMSWISSSPLVVIKYPDQGNLEKKELIWAYGPERKESLTVEHKQSGWRRKMRAYILSHKQK